MKKTSNGTNTYYPRSLSLRKGAHYHVENGYQVKYYFFNGQPRPVGTRRYQENGNNFLYLHADWVPPGRGSVVLTTYSGNGAVVTDQKFTGQKVDGTGSSNGQSKKGS